MKKKIIGKLLFFWYFSILNLLNEKNQTQKEQLKHRNGIFSIHANIPLKIANEQQALNVSY